MIIKLVISHKIIRCRTQNVLFYLSQLSVLSSMGKKDDKTKKDAKKQRQNLVLPSSLHLFLPPCYLPQALTLPLYICTHLLPNNKVIQYICTNSIVLFDLISRLSLPVSSPKYTCMHLCVTYLCTVGQLSSIATRAPLKLLMTSQICWLVEGSCHKVHAYVYVYICSFFVSIPPFDSKSCHIYTYVYIYTTVCLIFLSFFVSSFAAVSLESRKSCNETDKEGTSRCWWRGYRGYHCWFKFVSLFLGCFVLFLFSMYVSVFYSFLLFHSRY